MNKHPKRTARLTFLVSVLICCLEAAVSLQSSSPRSTQSPSLLADTQWKLQLDVGLQPGTWMPKRFPGWAESGARLGLGVEVEFSNIPSQQGETLVGSLAGTYQLSVTSPPTKFVSAQGEETVEFTSGGWCIQRPTANVRNAKGGLVKPEGLLKFWLDCPSGAKRQDVEIFPKTRIFFTTGVWDDPQAVEEQQKEYEEILTEIEKVKEQTRDSRKQAEDRNMFQNLATFRTLVSDSKKFDSLNNKREAIEQQLPPSGTLQASNGVRVAPNGSLVIKGNQTPDWMPGSEYLILGTFSTSCVDVM